MFSSYSSALDYFMTSREQFQATGLLALAEREAKREHLYWQQRAVEEHLTYYASEQASVDAQIEQQCEAAYYADWNF